MLVHSNLPKNDFNLICARKSVRPIRFHSKAYILLSGGSMLGPRGTGPPNLSQVPKFLIGSIVICLAVVASQMMRGQARQVFFLEPPLILLY